MALTINTALRNALADAVGDNMDSGTLVIKDSGATTLATFSLDAGAFADASSGTASASGLPKSVSASATGTADNAELLSSGSTYTITGLTVGTGSEDVVLDTTSITSGQDVNLTQLDVTMPAS